MAVPEVGRARRLMDEGKTEEAKVLLEGALRRHPRELEVLHLLNVCAGALKGPVPPTVQAVLDLTEGTQPAGELTLPMRARALALCLSCRAVAEARPSARELEAARRRFEEARALRPLPAFDWLAGALDAWRKFLARDFEALLERLRAAPGGHAAAADSEPHPEFVALAPVFATAEFREWIERKPRQPKKSRALDEALLVACGAGLLARRNSKVEDPDALGRPARVLALLHLGASLSARGEGGETVTHLLAAVGDAETLALVAKLGADLSAGDGDEDTPLHFAAQQNRILALRRLLELGANPDAAGEHHRTAAHDARSAEVVEALAAAGADFTLVDTSGRTPLDWAASQGLTDVAKALAGHADAKGRSRAGVAAAKAGKGALSKALAARAARLEVAPLLKALDEARPGFFPKNELPKLKDRLVALGLAAASWDQAVGHLQAPWWYALAIAVLAREALPPERRPKPFRRGPRLIRGDLVVKGHLHVEGSLLVTGDLKVGGLLTDAGHDSLIAVAGSLSAGAVITDGELSVAGDAAVAQFVFGHGNDHSFVVCGQCATPVLVSDQHDTQVGRGSSGLRVDTLAGRKVAKAFVPGVLVDGLLDRDALAAHCKAGRPVLR